jgi:uncharacterized membrane protein
MMMRFLVAAMLLLATSAQAAGVPAVVQVAGRLHMVALHFPLVLVLLALALVFIAPRLSLAETERETWLQRLLVLTATCTVLAVATGLVLAAEEDFTGPAAKTFAWHRAGGIAVAVLVLVAGLLPTAMASKARMPLLAIASALVLLVGHLGGNLVHGDGYVLAPLMKKKGDKSDDEGVRVAASDGYEAEGGDKRTRWPEGPIADKPDYAQHIAPLFERSCTKCHGAAKRKGGLRLDEKRYAMKGGETGPNAIVPGDPDKSLVYTMCALPPDDEDVMPERGKLLALSEVENIKRWIAQGAVWPD